MCNGNGGCENEKYPYTQSQATASLSTAPRPLISCKKGPDAAAIEIAGRIDTTTAPALEKAINEDIGDAKNLVLDMKAVQYISSAGLRVLLSVQKKMQKIGSMKVVHVCEEVMEVFEMTGFADILVIE